jgi:hypothetical protein
MERHGPAPCLECETTRKQYVDMRRVALQLAQALERWHRSKPRNSPSVTELLALVEARR